MGCVNVRTGRFVVLGKPATTAISVYAEATLALTMYVAAVIIYALKIAILALIWLCVVLLVIGSASTRVRAARIVGREGFATTILQALTIKELFVRMVRSV